MAWVEQRGAHWRGAVSHTEENYRRCLRLHIAPRWGSMPPGEVKASAVLRRHLETSGSRFVFTGLRGGPLWRSTFDRRVLRPCPTVYGNGHIRWSRA